MIRRQLIRGVKGIDCDSLVAYKQTKRKLEQKVKIKEKEKMGKLEKKRIRLINSLVP